jgi:hypothetical protein
MVRSGIKTMAIEMLAEAFATGRNAESARHLS